MSNAPGGIGTGHTANNYQPMTPEELNTELGNIDLFLLDQILKGRIDHDVNILDAGCGEGRNLIYFLRNSYKMFAIDRNPSAIKMIQMHARTLNSDIGSDRFVVGELVDIPFPDEHFKVIISLATLHFANGVDEFQKMIREFSRVLGKEGILIIKLDSNQNLHGNVTSLGDGLYQTNEGSLRYLLSNEDIQWLQKVMKFELIEPVKYETWNNRPSIANLVLKRSTMKT